MIKDELVLVYNKLSSLISQFGFINIKILNKIPMEISELTIGKNKMVEYLNGTIKEVNEEDLRGVILLQNKDFDHCNYLERVEIPENIQYIISREFEGVSSIISFNVNKNNSYYASDNCGVLFDKINSTILRYPAQRIETFYAIPDGTKEIDSYAFKKCKNLISVTIPDSVTLIGYCAFALCNNLENIYLKSTTPSILDTTAIPSTIITIHVPIGSGDAYKSATNWSSYADRIVEDIEI